jgi:hypothetical protein
MKRTLPAIVALAMVVATPVVAQRPAQPSPKPAAAPAYFPERLDWQHKKPEDVGMNSSLVSEAVQLAVAADTPGPHDMALFLHNSFGKEPYSTIVGPIKDRGPATRSARTSPTASRRRSSRPSSASRGSAV